MALPSFARSRVDRSALALGLAVGDLLAIGGFVVAGEIRHGIPVLRMPGYVGETLAVFLVGWAVASFLGGLYTRDALKNLRRVLSWTVPAWVLATLLIHGIYLVTDLHDGTQLTFVAVTLFLGGVLVVGWRLVASLVIE